MAQPAAGTAPRDDEVELASLAAARDSARRSYQEATAACSLLEGRPDSDRDTTERLLCAQDRVIAARDRYEAAIDRYDAARDRQQAAEYLRSSYRDELTGTIQRRAGETELRHEVDRARREGRPLVVGFVDVDGLKAVNDRYGHLAGDLVLRAVGTALLHKLRSYDVVIRFGGDEFVCALPGSTVAGARKRMADVQERLAVLSPGTTISVGLDELRPEDDLADVLRRADTDLYARRAQVRGTEALQLDATVVDLRRFSLADPTGGEAG